MFGFFRRVDGTRDPHCKAARSLLLGCYRERMEKCKITMAGFSKALRDAESRNVLSHVKALRDAGSR